MAALPWRPVHCLRTAPAASGHLCWRTKASSMFGREPAVGNRQKCQERRAVEPATLCKGQPHCTMACTMQSIDLKQGASMPVRDSHLVQPHNRTVVSWVLQRQHKNRAAAHHWYTLKWPCTGAVAGSVLLVQAYAPEAIGNRWCDAVPYGQLIHDRSNRFCSSVTGGACVGWVIRRRSGDVAGT